MPGRVWHRCADHAALRGGADGHLAQRRHGALPLDTPQVRCWGVGVQEGVVERARDGKSEFLCVHAPGCSRASPPT